MKLCPGFGVHCSTWRQLWYIAHLDEDLGKLMLTHQVELKTCRHNSAS